MIYARCRAITESDAFQNTIVGVILINAALAGLMTSQTFQRAAGHDLAWGLDHLIQAVFVVELTLRLLAYGPRFYRFFMDGWNLFDLCVVLAAYLPVAGPFATVARLARVLRITRLVTVLPDLRIILRAMFSCVPALAHVVLLLCLLLYVYGIFGYHLFHSHDPEHWGSLPAALLTLFQIITLDDWTNLLKSSLAVHPWSWTFYVSFVVLAIFIVINIFGAVVSESFTMARAQEAQEACGPGVRQEMLRQMDALRAQLAALETSIRRMPDPPPCDGDVTARR